MRKFLSMLLLGGLILVIASQCNKKEDPAPNPPPTNYTVDYKFQISGDYSDLKIEYFETGSVKKEVPNPSSPWEETLTNFVSGDSVYFHVTFLIPEGNVSVGWTWNVLVTRGSIFTDEGGKTEGHSGGVIKPFPKEIIWGIKLP